MCSVGNNLRCMFLIKSAIVARVLRQWEEGSKPSCLQVEINCQPISGSDRPWLFAGLDIGCIVMQLCGLAASKTREIIFFNNSGGAAALALLFKGARVILRRVATFSRPLFKLWSNTHNNSTIWIGFCAAEICLEDFEPMQKCVNTEFVCFF